METIDSKNELHQRKSNRDNHRLCRVSHDEALGNDGQ